jgi:hypothetical protein
MKNKFDELYEKVILESGLSRVWTKIRNHSSGTITAFRGDVPYQQNIRNNKKILAYLQSKGYSVTSIMGTYIENFRDEEKKEEIHARNAGGDPYDPEERHVQERSFLVVNDIVEGDDGGKLADDLFKLGEVFDQDSVMIIPVGGNNAYLWGTSKREESFPDYNTKHLVGSGKYGKTSGAFLSKIKGREFAFESIKSPQTINGKRGQMILLKEIEKQFIGDVKQ